MSTSNEAQAIPGVGRNVTVYASWISGGRSIQAKVTGRLDGICRLGRESFFVLDGGAVLVAATRTTLIADNLIGPIELEESPGDEGP